MGMVDEMLKANAMEDLDFVIKAEKVVHKGEESIKVEVNGTEVDIFNALLSIMRSLDEEGHRDLIGTALVYWGTGYAEESV